MTFSGEVGDARGFRPRVRRHVVAEIGRGVGVRATELDVTVSRVPERVQGLDFLPVMVAVSQQGVCEVFSCGAGVVIESKGRYGWRLV